MDDITRRIGALEVPRMALGTMYFGTRVERGMAWDCLDTAADLEATLWDTANNYAFWAGGSGDESESVIGEWFATRGSAARDRVVLASKVGARPLPGFADLDHVAGLSPRAMREQVVDSLRRLRTDRLDVLFTHIDDVSLPLEETAGALSDLVEEGLVREVAASNLNADRLAEMLAVPTSRPISALQQRFTYLRPIEAFDTSPQVVLDTRTEQIAADAGVVLLGYSPLLSGAYTRDDRPLPGEYATADNVDRLETVRRVATTIGLDAGQLVLAWMTQRHHRVTPIVGVSSGEQIVSAWTAVSTRLPRETLRELEAQ